MTTEQYLMKAQNERAEIARIDALQTSANYASKKADFLRKICLTATIVGTFLHMFGFAFSPLLPFIGLAMYLIVAITGFTIINLDDKAEKLQKIVKEKRKDLSYGKVETLLQLPAPKQNIEYQNSVTTYDKKIAKLNKR